MGDNFFVVWSGIIAAVFIFGGVQVRSGKTDFLGKKIMEQIRMEEKMNYCREMSMPLFLFALVELVDVALQLTGNSGGWSILVMGAGMIIVFVWIYFIHQKYKR